MLMERMIQKVLDEGYKVGTFKKGRGFITNMPINEVHFFFSHEDVDISEVEFSSKFINPYCTMVFKENGNG